MTKREYIFQDTRMCYYAPFSKVSIIDWLMKSEQYYLRRFVKLLRSQEYYSFIKPNLFLKYCYTLKKNKLGAKLGFFIPAGCFGPDLKIAHYGSVIVNPHSRIGYGCTIHGNCCIGNKGLDSSKNDSPVIGNDVNVGQGAQILGPIKIADCVVIAAGAIVVNDVEKAETIVAGVPARPVSR